MTEVEILKTLQRFTISAVSMSNQPTLPIKFIDVDFENPSDGKYLELVHIRNNPDDQYWGDEQIKRGLFRIILHWPNEQRGPYEPTALLESICSNFDKYQKMDGTLNISQAMKLMSTINNGQEILYPASLTYHHSSL